MNKNGMHWIKTLLVLLDELVEHINVYFCDFNCSFLIAWLCLHQVVLFEVIIKRHLATVQ